MYSNPQKIAIFHLICAMSTSDRNCGANFFTWGIRISRLPRGTYSLFFYSWKVWASAIGLILLVIMLQLYLRLRPWFSRLRWISWIIHCVALFHLLVASLKSIVHIWGFFVHMYALWIVLAAVRHLDPDYGCKQFLGIPVFALDIVWTLLYDPHLFLKISFLNTSLWDRNKLFFVRWATFWWQKVRFPYLTDNRSILFDSLGLWIWRHKGSVILILTQVRLRCAKNPDLFLVRIEGAQRSRLFQ